jgi:hypothetical protein
MQPFFLPALGWNGMCDANTDSSGELWRNPKNNPGKMYGTRDWIYRCRTLFSQMPRATKADTVSNCTCTGADVLI